MNPMARWIAAAGLLLVMTVALYGQKAQANGVPQGVRQAEQTVTRWLQGFDGQTLEEVRRSMGAPIAQSSWLYKGHKEPILEYRLSGTTKLSLYFVEGRVVKPSLHFLP